MAPDQWPHRERDLGGAWRAIEDLRYRIDQMATADEVAELVTEKVKARTFLGLSILQKAGAAVAGGLILAESLLSLVRGLS